MDWHERIVSDPGTLFSPALNDRAVRGLARKEGRCLMTFDADFGDLVVLQGVSPSPTISSTSEFSRSFPRMCWLLPCVPCPRCPRCLTVSWR